MSLKRAPSIGERKSPVRATAGDALAVLREDHRRFRDLFSQYEKLDAGALDSSRKMLVMRTLCGTLSAHAQVEEEILYPALREAINANAPPDAVDDRHQPISRLVDELQNAKPGDELVDAKMKVLSQYVQQHIDESESVLFPRARAAGFDLDVLGEQMMARKSELDKGEVLTKPLSNSPRRAIRTPRPEKIRIAPAQA